MASKLIAFPFLLVMESSFVKGQQVRYLKDAANKPSGDENSFSVSSAAAVDDGGHLQLLVSIRG